MPIPNGTSSGSSRRDVSTADLFRTSSAVPTTCGDIAHGKYDRGRHRLIRYLVALQESTRKLVLEQRTQPHCRPLHLLEGARARSIMGFDISDGFHNRKVVGLSRDCCPTQNAVHTASLSASSPLGRRQGLDRRGSTFQMASTTGNYFFSCCGSHLKCRTPWIEPLPPQRGEEADRKAVCTAF